MRPHFVDLCAVPLIFSVHLSQNRLIRPIHHVRRFRNHGQFKWYQPRSSTWAVLVSGSSGWFNYRHQADVSHAYHTLRNHGIPEDQIVTMMFDDVANSTLNPYPGKLFNRPYGEDVYAGVKINYKGADVNPANFLAVMQGNAALVRGGDGRVINSNRDDNIFIYVASHGGMGIVGFPYDILTVKELNDALRSMHRNQRYRQLVFYLEGSESGSMFNDVLPESINVYANTATNERESSWGTYCHNEMQLPCLGDLFSVNWMEHSDIEDIQSETLRQQFETVKERTTESHVMQYGNKSIADEFVAQFQGNKRASKIRSLEPEIAQLSAWPSRDIYLLSLRKGLEMENNITVRKTLKNKIARIRRKREYFEEFMYNLVEQLVDDPINKALIIGEHPETLSRLDCFDRVVKIFHEECFHFNRNLYAFNFAYVLANLCEERIETETIVHKLRNSCEEVELTGVQ